MLLILAGEHDPDARAAAARLGPQQATVLDATDLSRPGWRLDTTDPGSGVIVAGGEAMPASAVSAVLVRRLAIYPQELRHVHPEDRNYVACEMTALLAWWLHVLPAPVLNRPRGNALCGPGWRTEQWRATASRLGFPVAHLQPTTNYPSGPPFAATELTIVGDWITGKAAPGAVDCLRALASAAEVDLLYAAFDATDALITAHTLPPLTCTFLDAVMKLAGIQMEQSTIENPPPMNPLQLLCGGRA